MEVILPILIIGALTYMIYKRPFFHLHELPVWACPALFLLKLCFGFALWAVYTFYYTDRSTADIYKYFDDAHYIHAAYAENKGAFLGLMTGSEDSSMQAYTGQMKNWERNYNKSVPFNENRFMIRLNAVMMFISGENIHVHTVLFCFLSFVGGILLLKVFQKFLDAGKKKWGIAAILFPSFMFWTSGGLKESLIVLGLGLLLFGFIFLLRLRVVFLFFFVLGILVLIMTKYFLLLCLAPALVAYHLYSKRVTLREAGLKYAGVLIIMLTIVMAIAPIDRRIDFARIIAKKQTRAIKEAAFMNAGSYSAVPPVQPNILSVLKNLPTGLWNSMMKPYLWESRNPLMLLSAAENMVLLVLLIAAIIYRDRRRAYNYNILLFMLTSVILYFSIIGIMTPVLGNLVRYKVVMTPMLIFLLLYIVRPLPGHLSATLCRSEGASAT